MSKLVKLHPNMTGIAVRDCYGNDIFNIVHGKFYQIWPVKLPNCEKLKALAPADAKWFAVREEEPGKIYTGDIPKNYFWLVGDENLAFVPAEESEMKMPQAPKLPATAGMLDKFFKSPWPWVILAVAGAVLLISRRKPRFTFMDFGYDTKNPMELIRDTKKLANRHGYLLKYGSVPGQPHIIAFMLCDIEAKSKVVFWSKDIKEVKEELLRRIGLR